LAIRGNKKKKNSIVGADHRVLLGFNREYERADYSWN